MRLNAFYVLDTDFSVCLRDEMSIIFGWKRETDTEKCTKEHNQQCVNIIVPVSLIFLFP